MLIDEEFKDEKNQTGDGFLKIHELFWMFGMEIMSEEVLQPTAESAQASTAIQGNGVSNYASLVRGREIYDSETRKWYWLDADADEGAAVRDLISKELENAQLSEDGTMLVSPNGKSVSTTELAFAETASIDSVYINADAKADLYLTAMNLQLPNMSPGKASTEASRIVADLENDLRKDIPKGLSKEEENRYVKEYVKVFRRLISLGVDYKIAKKNGAEMAASLFKEVPVQIRVEVDE